MNKILASTGLLSLVALALLSISAFSQSGGGSAGQQNAIRKGTPPSYCNPCLFYGGDFDANNPTSNVLGNSYSTKLKATTYVPFYVPPGQTWTIVGLFSNDMSTVSFIDPPQIKWTISSGISTGNPGIQMASGKNPATWTPTGRTWAGVFTEYTALAHLKAQQFVTLTTGVYWMTAVPVCTNSDCGDALYYVSDVEDVPAPNHKGVQPNDDSYYLANAGRYFFAPTWGPTGVCQGNGCDKFSVGLLGYAKPSD